MSLIYVLICLDLYHLSSVSLREITPQHYSPINSLDPVPKGIVHKKKKKKNIAYFILLGIVQPYVFQTCLTFLLGWSQAESVLYFAWQFLMNLCVIHMATN